ncbi:hypothetical protein V8D89_006265 [Ganoderma adspersum]
MLPAYFVSCFLCISIRASACLNTKAGPSHCHGPVNPLSLSGSTPRVRQACHRTGPGCTEVELEEQAAPACVSSGIGFGGLSNASVFKPARNAKERHDGLFRQWLYRISGFLLVTTDGT